MILLGLSFLFAAIDCGLIDHEPLVEMDSDNLTTRNTMIKMTKTNQITTLEFAAMKTNTQSNTILLLNI